MSFLAAFLGGALGQGTQDVVQRADRRDAETRAEEARRRATEEERAYRSAEAEKQRQSQMALLEQRQAGAEDLAAVRAAGGGARGAGTGSASGARGGGGFSLADAAEDPAVVGALMRDGTDMATVRSRLAQSAQGVNPFTKQQQVAEQIDDGDRMRTVTRTQTDADPEAYLKFNQRVAQALMDAGPRSTSNFAQVTQGEGNRLGQGFTQNYVETGNTRMAEGATLLNKDALATANGTSTITGAALPNSRAQAQIRADDALAGEREAKAATEVDKREGKGSIRDDIAVLESQRKALDSQMKDARLVEKELADAGFRTKPEDLAAAKARRKDLEGRDAALQQRIEGLANRLGQRSPGGSGVLSGAVDPMEMARSEASSSGAPVQFNLGGKQGTIDPRGAVSGGAPSKPTLIKPPADLLAKAKKAIEQKAPRDAVLKRLRDAGYDTTGI